MATGTSNFGAESRSSIFKAISVIHVTRNETPLRTVANQFLEKSISSAKDEVIEILQRLCPWATFAKCFHVLGDTLLKAAESLRGSVSLETDLVYDEEGNQFELSPRTNE